MARARIGKQLELSTTPQSIIKTNASNEQEYVAPGANGQILTVVAGVPTWQAPVIPSEYELVASVAALPVVGLTDTIYIAKLENKIYYWDTVGLVYLEIPTANTFSMNVNGTGVGTVAQAITTGDTLTVQGAANSGIVTLGVATDILTIGLNEQVDSFPGLVAAATTVTATQTPIASKLHVYRNGMIQDVTTDYTLTGTVVTFVVPFGASGGATNAENVKLVYRYA